MATEKFAVTIPASLVEQMEALQAERKAIEAQAKALKSSEDLIKDQIKAEMGRYKRAAVGRTGRFVELLTVNQEEKLMPAYSYVLLKVRERVTVG